MQQLQATESRWQQLQPPLRKFPPFLYILYNPVSAIKDKLFGFTRVHQGRRCSWKPRPSEDGGCTDVSPKIQDGKLDTFDFRINGPTKCSDASVSHII